jgi:sulfur carrier protein ThiS
MQVIVELTGLARDAARQKEIHIELNETTTYQDIIRWLGKNYPQLIGLIIDQDGETFLSSNLFAINGDLANPAMLMQECPKDGDRLILMSVITGG